MKINKFTRKIIRVALNVLLVFGQTAFAADLPFVFAPLNPPVIVTPVISPLVRPSGAVLSSYTVHYETEQSVGNKFQNLNREELATGDLSGITAPGGAGLNFTYDGALPLSTVWSGPVSGSVARVFDNNFRVVSMSVNGAGPVAFGYDQDGLLTGVGSLIMTRNAANGLLTGTRLGSVTDAVTYSMFAEPQSYAAFISGVQTFKTEYIRDALGRVTRKVETIGGVTNTYDYVYDSADRLARVDKDGVTIEEYFYDDNGNRLSRNAGGVSTIGTYDEQDRLLNYGNNTYTYTANGELLTKTSAGRTTTYDYDILGNLMSAAFADGTDIEYIVDGQNRRVGKKVNGTLTQGFLYDGPIQIVAELDGNNNVISRFIYAEKGSVPSYMIKNGVTYRILSDHLGSPRFIIDTTTGAIIQRMDCQD